MFLIYPVMLVAWRSQALISIESCCSNTAFNEFWVPVFEQVNILDQAKDRRRHEQHIAHGVRPRIPIRVRNSSCPQNTRAGWNFDLLLAHLHAQLLFQHVPCFVIVIVQVKRRNQPRCPAGACCCRATPQLQMNRELYPELFPQEAERSSS